MLIMELTMTTKFSLSNQCFQRQMLVWLLLLLTDKRPTLSLIAMALILKPSLKISQMESTTSNLYESKTDIVVKLIRQISNRLCLKQKLRYQEVLAEISQRNQKMRMVINWSGSRENGIHLSVLP